MSDRWVVVLFFDETGIDLEDVAFVKVPGKTDGFQFGWDWGHKLLGIQKNFSTLCRVRCFALQYRPDGGTGNDLCGWLRYSAAYAHACQTRHPNAAITELHED